MITRLKLAGIVVSATLAMAGAALAQTAPYVRTAIVSPTPGNATASGTTLLTTIAGLSPAPSVTNRWLVKIEPGIFDLGATALQMVDYVDYEGSGPLVTIIKGTVGPTAASDDTTSTLTITTLNQGVVRGANNSEIRDLTIECVPSVGQPSCMGMINDTVSPKVTNIRIQITAASSGGHWGMRNYNASPWLNGLDLYIAGAASGYDNYGIVNVQASGGSAIPTIKNSQIVVGGASASNNWGVLNRGNAKMPIAHTNITASGGGFAAAVIHNSGGGSTGQYYIENSLLMATGASSANHGIDTSTSNDSTIRPLVFSSRVRGDNVGIKLGNNSWATVSDGQLYGSTYAVDGGNVYIGGTWIAGGTVNAVGTENCASVWNNVFTLYASSCP